MSTPGTLEHIQSLPSWLAGRVAARGRSLVALAIAAEDLKLKHLAVLAAAAQHGPLAQADLVRRLEIDAKDLVLLLNHLEQTGHVARDPDPRDRRKNAVHVTPQGTATLNRCLKLAEQANAELLSPLNTAERGQFVSLLTRLQAATTRQQPQLRFQLVDDATIEDWQYVHNTIIPTDPLSTDDVRERAQHNHLEVAYVHDVVVGCSTVRPPADEDPAATVIVRVLPEHRRLGYGTEFYERELEHAGTPEVQTVVLASNEDGLRFALARGFVEVERYVLPGETISYIDLRLGSDRCGYSAVYGDHGTGDVGAGARGEVDGDAGHVVGAADAAER